ncbi:unnamed protein product [Closterium sp. NIES-54]
MALVVAASRMCSNVVPDGPAPTPFSHLPRILANSAWVMDSFDSGGTGQVTTSCTAGGYFWRSSSNISGLGVQTVVDSSASMARHRLSCFASPSARLMTPVAPGWCRGGGGVFTASTVSSPFRIRDFVRGGVTVSEAPAKIAGIDLAVNAPFSPPPDTHSLVLRPFCLRFLSSPHGFPALEMVIAGAPEPSPGLAVAWSAVVAKPPAGPKRKTMATEPPLPPAPKHVTAVAEKTPPHSPAAPLAGAEAGPTAPAAVPSDPPASLGSLAPLVKLSASAPVGGFAEPPTPVSGAHDVPNASAPCQPAQASASSPKAASATTGEPSPSVAPAAASQSAPAVTTVVPASQPSRPPSPDRRDWRGSRARGGGGGYRPPVTMADLQREVSRAVREERAAQSQSSSLRALPAREAPRPAALPPNPQHVAAPPPQIQALPVPSTAVSAPAPGSRLHLPPVLPVAGATLGQLHRLANILHALLLLQVLAHSSLPVIPPETFRGRQRDSCLDAADQLAVLLAPVLAAPVEGGAAAAGQLDEAVRGLRRHLRAGSGAAAIGAITLVVRELWRSLTGVLHALGAHRM